MAEIEDFASAVAAVKGFARDPGNEAKLKLYALYKQASEGDVTGKRPGFTNPVGRAKHDAWAALSGTSPENAESQYVDLVRGLADRE